MKLPLSLHAYQGPHLHRCGIRDADTVLVANYVPSDKAQQIVEAVNERATHIELIRTLEASMLAIRDQIMGFGHSQGMEIDEDSDYEIEDVLDFLADKLPAV